MRLGNLQRYKLHGSTHPLPDQQQLMTFVSLEGEETDHGKMNGDLTAVGSRGHRHGINSGQEWWTTMVCLSPLVANYGYPL